MGPILGVFELLTDWFAAPGYRGCPFINASAETASGGVVTQVRDAHRDWAMVGAQLDGSPAAGEAARAAAAALIDAATV